MESGWKMPNSGTSIIAILTLETFKTCYRLICCAWCTCAGFQCATLCKCAYEGEYPVNFCTAIQCILGNTYHHQWTVRYAMYNHWATGLSSCLSNWYATLNVNHAGVLVYLWLHVVNARTKGSWSCIINLRISKKQCWTNSSFTPLKILRDQMCNTVYPYQNIPPPLQTFQCATLLATRT